MKKTKAEYRDVPFVPVLNGALGFFHRPSKGGLATLQELGCTLVVTLLSPTENPHEIGNWCKEKGLIWVWVGLQGANKKLLESNKTTWMLKKALAQVHQHLIYGDKVLVHCAAGIHRTGTFSYALLRISGYSQPDAMDTIRRIRQVTYEQCGQFRFELAENIAVQVINEGIVENIPEFHGMTNPVCIEDPLVFIKIVLLDVGMLKFECIVTDTKVKEYILGPFVNLIIDFKILKQSLGPEWVRNKQVKNLQGGLNKEYKLFETELLYFFTESFPPGFATLIGSEIDQDLQFLSKFYQKTLKHTTERTIQLDSPTTDTIFQEILSYKLSLSPN